MLPLCEVLEIIANVMVNPKAVIFDFDGVLVDSLGVHLQAWEMAAHELFGKSPGDMEQFKGRATHAISAAILKELGIEPKWGSRLVQKKIEILNDLPLGNLFYSEVGELFEFLLGKKIPFGIASNAPKDFIVRALSQSPFTFNAIVGRDDVDRGKPHPEPFLRCAKLLNIPFTEHREIVALDDSPHGIKAICAAKMIAIGIATAHTHERLQEAGAQKVFDKTSDLREMLTA